MSYTLAQARDLLLEHVRTGWNATGLDASNLVYDDIKRDSNPDHSQVWARVKIRHGSSQQMTLADATGKARFERQPTLTVQIFTPTNDGLTESDRVGQALLDLFEGKSVGNGCIWFRDAETKEMGIDGNHFNTLFTTTVIYDQIK